MVAVRAFDVRKEQRTAEPLGAIAIGVLERTGRMHGQAFGTPGRAIGIAGKCGMGMLIERNGSDAALQRGALIDVPGIKGSIGGDVGRIGIQGQHSVAVQGAEVGHIPFIERPGEIRHHHIAINGIGTGGDPRPIAEEADLFLFLGAARLLLVAVSLSPSTRCHAASAPAPHPVRCTAARSPSLAWAPAADSGIALPAPARYSPADLLRWPTLLPLDASRSMLAVLTSLSAHSGTASPLLLRTSAARSN